MYSRNAADAGAYCHRVVLSWALFPAMMATGTDRIFANLFWMGGDDLEKMKSGLSSQKGITMLRILNDTTKKHRTKICLVLFGAPAGIRIPDTLIKRIQGASFVKFQKVRRNVILSYHRKIRLCTHRIVCIQCNALQPLSSYSGVQKVCKNVQTGKTKPNGQINHRFYGRV